MRPPPGKEEVAPREGHPENHTVNHSDSSTRQGHDASICRLSRRRDRLDRIRFTVPDAGDGGAAEPDYIKRARRRRWAS